MAFNVKDYNATGGGVIDDRVAIQNAIDTCFAAGGGDVWFPVGIYLVGQDGTSARCIQTLSSVRLLGESREGSIIKQAPDLAASVQLLHISGNDCAIANLTLDGNKAMQSIGEHRHGIFAYTTDRLIVERVTSRNFTGDGFYLYKDVFNSTFTDVYVTANDRNGLTLGAELSGVNLLNCRFVGNAAEQIDSEPGAGNRVTNVMISGCLIDGGPGNNNFVITCSGSGSSDDARGSGWAITGNTIKGSVHVVWCDDVSIVGNLIINPTTKPCLSVYRTSKKVTITGNRLKATQTTQANVAAIEILGTATNWPDQVGVADNVIDVAEASAFGVRAQNAISVSVTGNLIQGAGIHSSLNSGIYLRPGIAFRSAVVLGNTIRNFGNYGIRVTPSELHVFDISHNVLDDTTGTMTTGIRLGDGASEAKQLTMVGNQCAGGVTTAVINYPITPILIGGVRGAGGIYSVNGSPEGVVTEKVGAIALRRDESTEATLYVKQSGTGNVGWVAK